MTSLIWTRTAPSTRRNLSSELLLLGACGGSGGAAADLPLAAVSWRTMYDDPDTCIYPLAVFIPPSQCSAGLPEGEHASAKLVRRSLAGRVLEQQERETTSCSLTTSVAHPTSESDLNPLAKRLSSRSVPQRCSRSILHLAAASTRRDGIVGVVGNGCAASDAAVGYYLIILNHTR